MHTRSARVPADGVGQQAQEDPWRRHGELASVRRTSFQVPRQETASHHPVPNCPRGHDECEQSGPRFQSDAQRTWRSGQDVAPRLPAPTGVLFLQQISETVGTDVLDTHRRLEPGADPQLTEPLGHERALFDAEGFVEGAGAAA